MAALFKSSISSNNNEKHHYIPARASSDEGEESLSSDELLEKDTIRLRTERSFLQRYAPLLIIHLFVLFLYLILLYFVACSYASSRRLNGPGVLFCTYKILHTSRVCANPYSTGTGSNRV